MAHLKMRDGAKLYCKTWGEGRPVVLIHGWPLSADSFDDLALSLAEGGYRAIAYDRRGFGRSDQTWSGYDYDSLADDLAEVLQQTDAGDATLVGFSMGGGEVARYLSRHRDHRVRSVVLISSVVPYMLQTRDNPDGVPQSTFDEMAAGMLKDRAQFFSGFFQTFYGVGILSQPVSDEVVKWSSAVAMQAGLRPTLACAEAFGHTDFRPDLPAINVPTLIIHGDSDKTVPIDTAGRAAAKGIAGSTLVEVPGGPHGLLATHKALVRDQVMAFVAR